MRVLVVSPYPPGPDGIASFALQSVRNLLDSGADVEVLSPTPSAAHYSLSQPAWVGVAKLRLQARSFDRVDFHYHLDSWLPSGRVGRLLTVAALGLLFRARGVSVIVHEADSGAAQGSGPMALSLRWAFGGAKRLVVFTESQRSQLERDYGARREAVSVEAHGRDFRARAGHDDQGSARARLGVDPHRTVFLSIGFLSPHKGFDRAIQAFAGAGIADQARLFVVGTMRTNDDLTRAHVSHLRSLAFDTDGVELIESFVSDEDFDRWLLACDVVVLPYRQIWSSSVLERARLIGRPAIVSDLGGLAEQFPEASVVRDDLELASAMASYTAHSHTHTTVVVGADSGDASSSVDHAQRLISERAAAAPAPAPPLMPDPGPGAKGLIKRLLRRLTVGQTAPLLAEIERLRRTQAPPERPGGNPTESERGV